MNETLFNVLQVTIIACIIICTRYLIPTMKSYISTSNYAWVASVIDDAVEMAEQVVKEEKSGAKKKAMVLDMVGRIFSDAKITITQDQLEALIESAVFAMNSSKRL